MPGAKLCGPCKAAIRRSRDASVWELPNVAPDRPRAIGPVPAVTREIRTVVAHPVPVPTMHAAHGATARVPGWLLMVVCVAIAGVTALSLMQTALPGSAKRAASVADEPLEPLHVDRLPPLRPFEVAPLRSVDPRTPPEAEALAAAKARETSRRVATPAPVLASTAPDVAPTRSEPVVVAALPAAPVAAVPTKTRWQQMNEVLDRCPGGLFDRVACEQRTRLEFCDGYWGQVAQCPAGIANDHGQ
jgi:hypothetical protein